MRTLIFVTLFCVLVAVVLAEKPKPCNDSNDCSEGKCCVKNLMFGGHTCQDLKKKGDLCFRRPIKDKDSDVYISWCPCGDGLKCEPQEFREETGEVVFKNAKCQ